MGNRIGLDVYGQVGRDPVNNPIGNRGDGVEINDSPGNTIGGTDPGERNVISAILATASRSFTRIRGNQVLGNYIGSDPTGTIGYGNAYRRYPDQPGAGKHHRRR